MKKDIIGIEKKSREWHIPGYHFCGPGTRVVTRLTSGTKEGEGINKLDEACKIHDIEYLKYAGDDIKIKEADQRLRKAASKIGGISGILVDKIFFFKKLAEKMGFISPSGFAKKLSKDLTIEEQRKLGDILYKTYIEKKRAEDIGDYFDMSKSVKAENNFKIYNEKNENNYKNENGDTKKSNLLISHNNMEMIGSKRKEIINGSDNKKTYIFSKDFPSTLMGKKRFRGEEMFKK